LVGVGSTLSTIDIPGVLAYSCSQCGNRYGRYPSLWKHRRKCRPEAPQGDVKAEPAAVVDEIVITENIDNMLPIQSFAIINSL
jgi:hypothetical protein